MKKRTIKIILSLVLFLVSFCFSSSNLWIHRLLLILSYLLVGFEIVKKAFRNILRGKIFDENFLMTIATLGAFAIGEFPEATAVMLFYQVGELFQSYAVDKSRKSITSLMDIRPDFANLKKDNNITKVHPEEVKIGDLIVVKPGEKIPLDGILLDGSSMLDTSSLTGESVPREVKPNDIVISGCLNLNGLLTIKVTKEFGESTVHKILELVENASSRKSKSEDFIHKFAKYYTPIVVIIAFFLAFLPPLFFGFSTFSAWLYRSLSFLVVSCPCALVISIPLSFFGGIGGASKIVEALDNLEAIVFDKTGTLTKGCFEVQKIEAVGISKEELLKLTAYAENFSNHPISFSLKKAYGKEIHSHFITKTEELPGLGISAIIEGKNLLVGNEKLMQNKHISYQKCDEIGTILYVALEGTYVGHFVIADRLKEDAKSTIQELKANNIHQIVMLTGDQKSVGEWVAKDLGIPTVYSELLPNEKAEKLEKFMSYTSSKGKVAFVGDGMNDAPVLALADIGIAMGGLGADSAIEAADIILMTDEPSKIVSSLKIARKTMRIVKENVIFALLVKFFISKFCKNYKRN